MKFEQKTRIIILLLVLMAISLICLMLPIILGIKMEVFVYSFLGLIALGLILSYLAEKTKNRDLIIPGKVAVIQSDVQDNLPDWNVIVGTMEAMELPKFLKEYMESKSVSATV